MRPPPTAQSVAPPPGEGWRQRLYIVIFEAETPAGRAFDLALLALILISVATVMLDSVSEINARFSDEFNRAEWFFTAAFTIEYVLRLLCVRNPWRYARSALGIIEQSRALVSEGSLVDALEVSERTLQRIFGDYIGLSPHEFIQLRRINHAIDSLKGSSRLTDIALDADFYDQAHFIKSFKSDTGYTPGEYRKILHSLN